MMQGKTYELRHARGCVVMTCGKVAELSVIPRIRGGRFMCANALRPRMSRWCAVGMFALASTLVQSAYAGSVSRSVTLEADGRVMVEIAWALPHTPSTCLIIQERIPSGWEFLEVEAGGRSAAVRHDAQHVNLAVGLSPPWTDAGALTYRLAARPDNAQETLHFEGTLKTLRDVQRVLLPIGGQLFFDTREHVFPELQLRFTDVASTVDAQGGALALSFRFDALESAGSRAFTVQSDVSEAFTLHVDFSPLGVMPPEWQCVYTSRPSDRAMSPGMIALPTAASRHGLYRLRIMQEESD